MNLYANDTTLHAVNSDLAILECKLREDLKSLNKLHNRNRLILNTDKIICMVISANQLKPLEVNFQGIYCMTI